MSDRRVKDMTAATQRFRRRVLAMLEARGSALYWLIEQTPEVKVAYRVTDRIRIAIKEMR